jgi:ADP-ribosyl-[dinitrogen reductase] hydrolase
MAPESAALADRVAGALWGMFIADALASPAHWFYGGAAQIRRAFGKPITGYETPLQRQGQFPESIMALSSTGGAGRGTSDGDIIGEVINHGKKSFWKRGSGYHYHATLQAGETTLEGEMARLAMKSMSSNNGFDHDAMQTEYANFMTTPGSHNDAYASSYHRMFFQNRANGKPLRECPSNDGHNVDAIDGLVIPAVVLLGGVAQPESEALVAAKQSVRVTRSSPRVEAYVGELSIMIRAILHGEPAASVAQATAARMLGGTLDTAAPDPVVACYIDNNFASLLHLLAKYGTDFKACVLANANAGGENVHRGLVLGALIGAHTGAASIPDELKKGLRHAKEIEAEIDAFISARLVGNPEVCR